MDDSSTKKLKVDLTKIPYQIDVAIRSHLPFLDKTGVLLLQELLFSSLETNVEELADSLELPISEVEEGLSQLVPLALFVQDGSKLSINKERRRVLETEAARFEEGFHPDLQFLKTRLSFLSPSVLLDWYVVPRTCHDIFSSLIEKHFFHPRYFHRHLDDLQFADPRLQTIVSALYRSDELALSFLDLQIGFGISREELHTLILQLEYHFVAFIKYVPTEEGWEEFIVPLKEWTDYMHYVEKGVEPATFAVKESKEYPKPQRGIELRERQIKGVERRLKEAKVGAWIPVEQFLMHLDVPMQEPHEPFLESKGRRWLYSMPVHTPEERATFRSLLFERFAKNGALKVGEKDGKWYFSLTPKSIDYLS